MKGRALQLEAVWVQLLKSFLLAVASAGFLWQIAGVPTILATMAGVFLSSQLAYILARFQFRIIIVVVVSLIFVLLGGVSFGLVLNYFVLSSPGATIHLAQSFLFVGLGSGLCFVTRSLAQRYRWAEILELALVASVVVFIFFAHRDFNITYPRFFADWAFSEGYDPIVILRALGVATAFVSLLLLLRKSSVLKVVISLIVLLILGLLAFRFLESVRIPTHIENPVANALGQNEKDSQGEDDSDSKQGGGNQNDKDKGSGSSNNDSSGNSSNNKPQPVAIAVFYDEFSPADGYFYFRQNVLSKYDGNHLVASDLDEDVITQFPLTAEQVAKSPQSEQSHVQVKTSMYLIHDHPTPPQLSHALRLEPIPNPDSKLFVSTYGVESLGMQTEVSRMIGRHSVPAQWSQETRAHYLAIPDDPRYRALSDIIVRAIDPRFADDDIVKALSIRAWLEREVYYTLKTTHIDNSDPTASFLFGSLRGYCVHIAHAAVFLLRSQGIAARVALGYAVDNRLRGSNSAVLLLSDQAHAWPEIYVDGIGWVSFDIAPENGDVEPRPFVDQDLESLFGELARDDKSGGRSAVPKSEAFQIPWRGMGLGVACVLLILLVLAYLVKGYRILSACFVSKTSRLHFVTRSALDVRAMLGQRRARGETLESFALRQDSACLQRLFLLHAQAKMGSAEAVSMEEAQELRRQAAAQAFGSARWWVIVLGILNPITWVRL